MLQIESPSIVGDDKLLMHTIMPHILQRTAGNGAPGMPGLCRSQLSLRLESPHRARLKVSVCPFYFTLCLGLYRLLHLLEGSVLASDKYGLCIREDAANFLNRVI